MEFNHLERNLERIHPKADYFIANNKLVLPRLPKNQLEEFLKGLLPRTKLLIEPKIVGCTIALQYIDGKLKKSITREGKDVTNKIVKVQDIPKQLAISSILQVRGELYASYRTPKFSKRITSQFLRVEKWIREDLSFCSFQILNTRLNQFEAKKYLKEPSYFATHYIYCNFTSQIKILGKTILKRNYYSVFKR